MMMMEKDERELAHKHSREKRQYIYIWIATNDLSVAHDWLAYICVCSVIAVLQFLIQANTHIDRHTFQVARWGQRTDWMGTLRGWWFQYLNSPYHPTAPPFLSRVTLSVTESHCWWRTSGEFHLWLEACHRYSLYTMIWQVWVVYKKYNIYEIEWFRVNILSDVCANMIIIGILKRLKINKTRNNVNNSVFIENYIVTILTYLCFQMLWAFIVCRVSNDFFFFNSKLEQSSPNGES